MTWVFPYPIEIAILYGRTTEDLEKILSPFITHETKKEDFRKEG